jgi:hypothetical protein
MEAKRILLIRSLMQVHVCLVRLFPKTSQAKLSMRRLSPAKKYRIVDLGHGHEVESHPPPHPINACAGIRRVVSSSLYLRNPIPAPWISPSKAKDRRCGLHSPRHLQASPKLAKKAILGPVHDIATPYSKGIVIKLSESGTIEFKGV